MYVLIILMTVSPFNVNNSTSQQITFSTKQGCESAALGVRKQKGVYHSFCVERDGK